jgi:spore maturation protein CgeB
LRGDTHVRRAEENPEESLGERGSRELIRRYVTPRWRRHLERILEREGDVDAVVIFTVPMSHLRGIPTALRERFGVPVAYYDADVPMSLPEYGGMDTGFNIYLGADPSEYDLVLSNSEGGLGRLRQLGAKRAEALFWGADPELFAPLPVEKEHDVFFYAYGDKFRRNWMGELIGEPSRRLSDVDFVLGGTDFRGDVGDARELGYFPVNLLSRVISASRINLNVARKPHAEVYASSTSRLFELAAAGAAIVTNPYEGIDRWFEPGRELLVVSGADEAVEAYQTLLDNPGAATELGRRARERVLEEHTFADRARRLLDVVGVGAANATAIT